METEYCPHCGEEWNGYECLTCGFAGELFGDEYETPSGTIVRCTEEEAFERGYIFTCPVCNDTVIQWWEMEDHGMCIHCWHNKNRLTK